MQRVAILAMLAACSGGAGGGGPGHGTGPTPVRADAGAPVAEAAPVTVRECDELIGHAAGLAGAARGSGSAAPTAAELDSVAATLRAELGVPCAALPRPAYTCAMVAATLDTLAACER